MSEKAITDLSKTIFESYDFDKNGFLDKNELETLLKKFFPEKTLDQEGFDALFDKCDKNKDGKISREEFNDAVAPFIRNSMK